MYFKRLEINGFKSFADPVTIEFTDGITCIVGPNGSGKSNISDAIRWVLGEQSPKSLRGSKMEDVIFAGTENRKAKGLAEVTLVIDNSEHTLPIDFAEVGITRRMYRSGESEYMINRTPCRLRDIRELIMDTGIGVEGYSIIGQGKISDIVSNKMESRREIFEEAAGIVKYRSKKEEAERKLASASANLERVSDIVGEIEGRIGNLKTESEKAAEYLEIRDKYKDVEINIILKNIEAADSKSVAVREEIAELESAIATLKTDKEEKDAAVAALRRKSEDLEEKLDALRTQLSEKNEEIHRLSGREELNREKLSSLDRDDERLKAELASLEEKSEREQSNARGVQDAMNEALSKASELSGVYEKKNDELASAAESLAAAENELEEKKAEIFRLSSSIAELNARALSLDGIRQGLLVRAARIEEGESEGNDTEKKLSQELKLQAEKLEELASSSGKLLKDAEDASSQIDAARIKFEETGAASQGISLDIGKASARHKLIEELEHSYEGYGSGVKFLLGENVGGVIGVLGELIKVPSGWELAIETALGAKMRDIVCEDESVAKKSIELLKKNRAGRLTFLPVKSLKAPKPLAGDKISDCRGYLGLAWENVSCRGGYDNVIEYLLGNVAVCEDIDSAIEMSKKGTPLKFVTIEGEVVNAAGAITGGSLKNNTANILTRKAEKEDLEKQLNSLNHELAVSLKAHEKAQTAMNEAAKLRDSLKEKISANEAEMLVLKQQQAQTELMLNDCRLSVQKHLEELADIKAEAEKTAAEAGALHAQTESNKAVQTQLQEGLSDSVNAIQALRESLEKIRGEATQAQVDMNNASERARSAKEIADRVLRTIEDLKKDKELKLEALANNGRLREEILSAGDFAKELQQMESERDALADSIENLSGERREALSGAEAAEDERRESEEKLYQKQLDKHDADVKLARFDSQTDTLKEKLFDEFDMSYAEALDHSSEDFVMSRALKESREYKDRLRQLGDVNVGAIEEYKQVKERYEFLTAQQSDIIRAMDELKKLIRDMDGTIKSKFQESFDSVGENFEETFTELFGGGKAKLTMADPDNPLESAIEIEAQPPGKKLQNITLLSGGEKTMTAIALMFAVLKSKPTPFCILDEVEAALDGKNIDVFSRYLKHFEETQFALITHQDATMEYADVLYGVTMPEHGVTKVLSLKIGDK